MATLVNSNWLRTWGYLFAAAAALVAGRKEARSRTVDSGSWPLFWYLASGALLAMALARWTDIGRLLPDLGRRRARAAGWYYRRRRFQAAVIAVLSASLLAAVALAFRWLPANRRRYLPEAIVVLALATFAAVRLVSLHQVDALLYRRRIEGVKLDAVVELAGLATAIVIPFRHLRVRPASLVRVDE